MKKLLLSVVKLTIVLLSIFSVFSCALRPIPSEYQFVDADLERVELDKLGNGKVLIYNAANFLHNIDNTSRLNIWIDNKAAGQIRAGEYIIFDLNVGKHQLKVVHIDMVKMKSLHDIEINQSTTVIKIKPTITSNRLEITNALPQNFSKYKYAVKRK